VSVRIRLTRAGRKKIPHYRIVVMDSRNRRDGAYLDQIGVYHPSQKPAVLEINEVKALKWLGQGASPSLTVKNLFSSKGLMLRFDLVKRGTPEDKVSESVAKFLETAAAAKAQKAERRAQKRKAKAAASGSAEAAQSA
jgi:small subunit ribosomal protein S16